MTSFLTGIGVIFQLEMRQRVRGVAWYVLLGIFVLIVAGVTFLVWLISTLGADDVSTPGASIYSTIVYLVLLLGTLVAPALSGNAINGDRDAGTLATVQVTLATTGQLVLGKFLAAWVSALAFLVASAPFILAAALLGGLELDTFFVSLPVLALELGVVAAIGVGLSGLLGRPLFSVVVTYLAVAALSVGTLIAFALGGLVVQTPTTYTSYTAATYDESTGVGQDCGGPVVTHSRTPRFDYFWGALAANPYVVLADATPTHYSVDGYADDLFGNFKYAARIVQVPPETSTVWDDCDTDQFTSSVYNRTQQDVIESTTPSWFVGLAVHLVLAAAALLGAWAKLRTPARRLGTGSRIA